MRQVPTIATVLFKLGVFGAGAYLSVLVLAPRDPPLHRLFAVYPVGIIFGAVVLVWHTRSLNKFISLRSLGFLTASTLIWILVYILTFSTHNIITRVFKYGGYGPVIILGTILLTIAHRWLLGTPLRRVLIAIPCIFGIWGLGDWYLSHAVYHTSKYSADSIDFGIASLLALLYSTPIWQGAYLLCMFISIPQFLRTRFLLFRKAYEAKAVLDRIQVTEFRVR